MIVVDASVLANALADDGADGTAARARLAAAGELAAPDLVDIEAVAVLRKRWIAGDLTGDPQLREEGEQDEAAGAVQEGVGTARRKVGEAIESVGEQIKR